MRYLIVLKSPLNVFKNLSLTIKLSVIFASRCLEALVAMGYNRSEIEASLSQVRYDDVFATYLLLGRKSTDVSWWPSHSEQQKC